MKSSTVALGSLRSSLGFLRALGEAGDELGADFRRCGRSSGHGRERTILLGMEMSVSASA